MFTDVEATACLLPIVHTINPMQIGYEVNLKDRAYAVVNVNKEKGREVLVSKLKHLFSFIIINSHILGLQIIFLFERKGFHLQS